MDRRERNRLIEENLPLVGYLVSEVAARATHLDREELAAAGSLALVTAAEAFDPTLGVPFGAYARRRIVGAFADEMRSADWAGRGTRRRIKEAQSVQEALSFSLGRKPTLDEIATAMGVDRATAKATMDDAGRVVTELDDMASETLAATTPLPEENLLQAERLRYLRAGVAALPERLRFIVEEVYFKDRPVGEVAEELGVTHSAVSQQRTQAMAMLREGLSTHYGDADRPVEVAATPTTASGRRAVYLAQLAANASLRADISLDIEERAARHAVAI